MSPAPTLKRSTARPSTSHLGSARPLAAGSRPDDVHELPGRARVAGVLLGTWAGSVGVVTGVAGVRLPTLALLAAAAFALLGFPLSRLRQVRVTMVDVAAGLWLLARVAVELIDATRLHHPPNLVGSLGPAVAVLGYAVARIAVQSRAELRALLGGLAAPAAPVAVLGILQLAGNRAVTTFLLSNTHSTGALDRLLDGRATRATSLIGHWSSLGGYLCCIEAAIGLALLLDRREGRRSWWLVGTLGAVLVGLVCTLVFAAIILGGALAVLIAVRSGMAGRSICALLALGAGVVYAAREILAARLAFQTADLPYDAGSTSSWLPATLAARVRLWTTEGFPTFREQPLTGWGQSAYTDSLSWFPRPKHIVWPYAESEYLRTLVTGGLVTTACLLFLLVAWWRLVRRASVTLLGSSSSVVALLYLGLLLGAAINPYFTNPGVPAVWWSLLGALTWGGLLPRSGRHESDVEAPALARGFHAAV